ncbi:hypothetical protein AbraIFM66950_006739 [Aspergillus brasiliensis]|nr:hypothetical protein AbraIFM66950_006739 [Aspergillus brasiliensis]
MPPSTELEATATNSGDRNATLNAKAQLEATPATDNPTVADADAARKRRREKKRQARRRREEASYILKDLHSGERTLYLQEVPRVKASHCKAWDCAIRRRTREKNIRSHYRFALKGGQNTYGGELTKYYHITCIEHLIPNLGELVGNGHLKLEGWVCAPVDCSISVESSTQAIKDWFEYGGCTFDIQCYEKFKADHEEWIGDISPRSIEHQLGHGEGGSPRDDCYYCDGGPAEPREPVKSDYFPAEPTAISLSRLLAVVSDEPHIDKLWRGRREKKGLEMTGNKEAPQASTS